MNLRGLVLPVIDLAARLGWKAVVPTTRHAIFVISHDGQSRGLIVDAVSDLIMQGREALPPPPATSGDTPVPLLEGLAGVDERMVMILDLRAIGSTDEMAVAA